MPVGWIFKFTLLHHRDLEWSHVTSQQVVDLNSILCSHLTIGIFVDIIVHRIYEMRIADGICTLLLENFETSSIFNKTSVVKRYFCIIIGMCCNISWMLHILYYIKYYVKISVFYYCFYLSTHGSCFKTFEKKRS